MNIKFDKKEKNKIYHYMLTILIVAVGIYAFINADAQSLWADELSTIGFVCEGLSFKQTLHYFFSIENNLPLYSFFMYVWYRLTPFGEQYILLPSIIFSLISFIFIGKTVKRIIPRAGSDFFAVCICCGYSRIYYQVFWEARCYAMLIMFSAMALYYFVCLESEYTRKDLIGFGITQFLLLWTHWYSVIPVGFFGLFTLISICKKEKRWSCLLPFVVDGVMFLPWLVHALSNQGKVMSEYWYGVPSYKNVLWVIMDLCNSRYLYMIGFGLAIIALILEYSRYKQVLYCLVTILVGIGVMYVYSRFINPEKSLFYSKYFLVLFPMTVTAIAVGYDGFLLMIEKIFNSTNNRLISYVLNGVLLLYVGWGMRDGYISAHSVFQDYRQLAVDLVEDEDIYNEDSLLIASNKYCVLDGFIDFYFNKKGLTAPPNIVNGSNRCLEENTFYQSYSDMSEPEILRYRKIYAVPLQYSLDEELISFLEVNYFRLESANEDLLLFCRK